MRFKKINQFISLLMICSMFCGFNISADDAVPIESIKISLLNSTMLVGETQKMSISIAPTNAENYKFEYFSSNSEVVTAAIGTLIANSEGTADITVKVKDTDISDTITLTVAKSKDVLVSDIEFNNENIYLERYDEIKIKYDILPSNATNQNVTFESLNTAVVTITSDGVVYGKNTGSTRIKVQSADGNVIKYVYVTVENYYSDYYDIGNSVSVRRVDIYDDEDEITKTVEIMYGQTKQFTAQIYPDTATDKRIRWKTDDAEIAWVSENGVVTGVSEGIVRIYAIARDNGRQDVITVKIIPFVRYPDTISIAPEENALFETGQTIRLIPVFYPAETTERELRWYVYSGNATVDYYGNVTIIDKGTVVVKAYSQDWEKTASYEFENKYNSTHFVQIKEDFGVKQNRPIFIDFDTEVNLYSAKNNIFASTDSLGNQNPIEINITVDGKRIIIEPLDGWNAGENYIFIKSGLCDIYGNQLELNLKYKFITKECHK